MTAEAFIEAVRAQVVLVPWLHILNPPATSSDIDTWSGAYTGYSLPEDMLSLYSGANGMSLHHIRYEAELVGGVFTVPSISAVEPLVYAMYGKPHHRDALVSRHWFAVGRASDAAYYVALDLEAGQYWEVAPIIPDEAKIIANSCGEYLDWMRQFLPDRAELENILTERTA